jgi:hypothetical protein
MVHIPWIVIPAETSATKTKIIFSIVVSTVPSQFDVIASRPERRVE